MSAENQKYKMIIVCGGRGKRMGNLTNKVPKPLIKIGNKTIIEHKIAYYQTQRLHDFIFCLGYKSKLMKNYLIKKTPKSIFHDGGINAGILKRIFLVKKHIKDHTIISYGDTLAQINFRNLLNNHKKSKCLLTIVAAPIQNPFGLLNWNKNGKAIFFNEKPILNHYIGYMVISPNFFEKINNRIINLKDGNGIVKAIKYLIKKKQVNIYRFNNLQVTINSQEELKHARLNYKKYFTI